MESNFIDFERKLSVKEEVWVHILSLFNFLVIMFLVFLYKFVSVN